MLVFDGERNSQFNFLGKLHRYSLYTNKGETRMLNRKNWMYIIICVILAVVAEVSLFQAQVGISYSLFVALFYSAFFYLFRQDKFKHKQINGLLFITITLLSMMFLVYSNPIFNTLNSWLIPFLILGHTVLLTSSKDIRWYRISFLSLLSGKLVQTFKCFKISATIFKRECKGKINSSFYQTGKKMGIGILISIPLLFVILMLLAGADQQFANFLFAIPDMLFTFQLDFLWRFMIIVFLSFFFYCYFKVVKKKTAIVELTENVQRKNWDTIIISTVLSFINLVYLLFAIVQFQYFFSGTVAEGFTYAEYARRGFFELIVVTIINYVILMGTLTFAKKDKTPTIKILLTLLIAFTGVLLTSAFLRLMLYEQAFGFTYSRVLAHAFMIYLFIIFSFNLIKVWVPRLSLARFYIIITLLFYVGLNVVGIDQIIVTNNIKRYEMTGKIDVQYISQLSYSAIPPLVELFQEHPEIEGLETFLMEKRARLQQEKAPWQSFNLSRERARKALTK